MRPRHERLSTLPSLAHHSWMRVALTIAGSDSGGGAGIQADLKTFHRFGLFGTSVITAVTAQNTLAVTHSLALPRDLVTAQLDAVATDLRPAALKSGMLANAAIVRAVAAGIRSHRLSPYVLDPVIIATSGTELLESDAVRVLLEELLPLTTVITPNLDEAERLLGGTVRDETAMERAARAFVAAGAKNALITGGHLTGPEVVDVLYDGARTHSFRHQRLTTPHTHGSGCTLSAAITAHLALGCPLVDAVSRSLDFVHAAIADAPRLGAGSGPLNHFA